MQGGFVLGKLLLEGQCFPTAHKALLNPAEFLYCCVLRIEYWPDRLAEGAEQEETNFMCLPRLIFQAN